MRRWKVFSLLILLALALLVLAFWVKPLDPARVVGTWQAPDGTAWTFMPDGAVVHGKEVYGCWSNSDDWVGSLEVAYATSPDTVSVFITSITGNPPTLEFADQTLQKRSPAVPPLSQTHGCSAPATWF